MGFLWDGCPSCHPVDNVKAKQLEQEHQEHAIATKALPGNWLLNW